MRSAVHGAKKCKGCATKNGIPKDNKKKFQKFQDPNHSGPIKKFGVANSGAPYMQCIMLSRLYAACASRWLVLVPETPMGELRSFRFLLLGVEYPELRFPLELGVFERFGVGVHRASLLRYLWCTTKCCFNRYLRANDFPHFSQM
jgi:hypothetical protein